MSKETRKQPPPVSFYLGSDDRDRRVKALEEIAAEFGITRSVLIQKIADGELTVTPAPDQRRTRTA